MPGAVLGVGDAEFPCSPGKHIPEGKDGKQISESYTLLKVVSVMGENNAGKSVR